jgi:hypothetical protein
MIRRNNFGSKYLKFLAKDINNIRAAGRAKV